MSWKVFKNVYKELLIVITIKDLRDLEIETKKINRFINESSK